MSDTPRLLSTVPIVTGPLTKGTRVGTWIYDVIQLVNGVATTAHNLGRTPNGFMPIYLSANVSWWHGSSAGWTPSTATINANGVATLAGFWL